MSADPARRVIVFMERLFREYYSSAEIYVPSDYRLREYAANLWGQKTYIRHMSFDNPSRIKKFLAEKGPRHFYYSSARYMYPEEKSMDNKGWLSADLVFDIDADHLPGCGEKVVKVESVFGEESFLPETCIRRAGFEAIKLVDVLVAELGFDKRGIRLEFSGHRGFHVVVEDKDEWGQSGSEVRRELVNYLKAVDLLDETLYPPLPLRRGRGSGATPLPPLLSSPGLRGRLARLAVALARREGIDLVRVARAPEAYLAASREERAKYHKYLEKAREELGVEVDEQVTVDTKRLIRPAGSLHGKTGLRVEILDFRRVEDYTLTEETSPFHRLGGLRVRAYTDTPVIEVLGNRLRLRKGTVYRLPGGVAVYLLAKGIVVPHEPLGKRKR